MKATKTHEAQAVIPITQQHVTYYKTEGPSLVGESRPVASRDVNQVHRDMPEGTYAFDFFEVTSVVVDGETLSGGPKNRSEKYYPYSGTIYTLYEVKAGEFQRQNKGWYSIAEHESEEVKQRTRDDTDLSIADNMERIGCDRVLIRDGGQGGLEFIARDSIVLAPLRDAVMVAFRK